ncbi:rhodanese family protein [Chelatococcus sambhunathii]|uniref:Rhodanese family protein n=1 Tax=Chelatococcus sambhunathii TaxID=363953 RepID=A0ABU1DD99_9HYPH|nr:rhodanese-like domain-containing protein [Chelatococcus sambhunathii]MDR4306090.1 rhodanese family protein [Chelatococcus sambhunathii]
MPNDPIIEPSAITAPIRYVDVRDASAFASGHAPNAALVPIGRWEQAAKAPETDLSNAAFWGGEIRALGLDGETVAAVYDDGRMTEAARVWFILQHFGIRAAIVNGGWPALSEVVPLPAGEAPSGAGFVAQPGAGAVGLVDRERLKAELGDGVSVLDARTAAEHHGDDLRKNSRGGHLPGARLLAHADLLDHGSVRSPEDLRARLEAAGFGPGDHLVTHCDGGGRAALAAAAALRAGYADVRAYYLSFADWARDETCTVVRD